MIMDASSMVCLGASTTVSNRAIDVLRTLPASKNANRRDLCGQWYPQSWASTVFYGDLTDGEKPALSMIPTNDFASYNNFKSAWLSLILTNMAEYVQAKLMLSSQFLLAGDSINAEIYSWRGLLLLPLETLKALRLVSIFPILTLLLWLSFRSRKNGLKNTRKIGHLKLLSAFYLSFCAMSVISFIGDNQRYLFTGSMLVILFSFLLELGYEE
jgi:hypothetical protein